ncbi:MAG: hypothetical protein RLZZ502_1221 [Pseudomonadota bacterium]
MSFLGLVSAMLGFASLHLAYPDYEATKSRESKCRSG